MGQQFAPLNYYGQRLLGRLRFLRAEAGMLQTDVCRLAEMHLKKLSRLENLQLPSDWELRTLLKIYNASPGDRKICSDLLGKALERPWWRDYLLEDTRLISMEDVADYKYEFAMGCIPTLLQTERYARVAVRESGEAASSERAADLVAVRIRLQQRLIGANPLKLHSLIHASALNQKPLDLTQIKKLIEMMEWPNVYIQLVPHHVYTGLSSSVAILSFEDEDQLPMAFSDTLAGLMQSSSFVKVATARAKLDSLSDSALSPADTLRILKGIAWDLRQRR